MCVCLMKMEKEYEWVNRKALCHVLRLYDVAGNLLNSTKIMYVNMLIV